MNIQKFTKIIGSYTKCTKYSIRKSKFANRARTLNAFFIRTGR